MKTKFKALVGLTVIVLIALWLAGCDHYVCTSGATFGASSCTASGSGLGTGTGGNATAAFVFAVNTVGDGGNNGTAGAIDGFTLNTTASTLSPTANYVAPAIPQHDPGVGLVVAQGKFLYAAFPSTSQIFGWTISSTGGLTQIGNPTGTPTLASVDVGQQSMIVNPAGTLLFIANPGFQEIVVYQIGSGGALSAPTTVSTGGFTPENLTTDGLGKYLYVTDGNPGFHDPNTGILAFSISTGSGNVSLTQIGTTFTPAMWQVAGEPTGKFLIGTTGRSAHFDGGVDDDNLYVFSIQQTGATAGALTEIGPFSTGTASPFSIAVQPNANANLVYSFSIQDSDFGFNPIEGFSISSNGTLTLATTASNISANGFWGQFDQSGAFLFPYSQTVDQNNVVTTQIGALSIGSGGALTQIGSQVTLVTPGFWAVTDAP